MKAVTLHAPWGWLIGLKLKRFETRSWHTPYRGPIAIHQGKNRDALDGITEWVKNYKQRGLPLEDVPDLFVSQFLRDFKRYGEFDADGYPILSSLPLGAVIATGRVVNCFRMTEAHVQRYRYTREGAYGNWAAGRFAWEIADVKMLPQPVYVRGQQGLWDWDEKIA